MPYVATVSKAADEVKVRRRGLLIVWARRWLSEPLSHIIPSSSSAMHIVRRTQAGAATCVADSLLVSAETGTDWTNTGFMVGGSLFMGLLMWLRRVFVWWPLHPIGYTMLSSWALIKAVALNLYRLDDKVYSRQVRGIENVSRCEADIPWACAWRDDLRWNLGTCWNGNRRQHGLSNLAELK